MPQLKYLSALALTGLLLSSVLACQGKAPEPESRKSRQSLALKKEKKTTEVATTELTASVAAKLSPAQAKSGLTGSDPLNGIFTLASAIKGLKTEGRLLAKIDTDDGLLTCELFEEKAPLTVANFVGLARGLRPFKDKGKWQQRPAYDGTNFHRVVKGFMIQGGDPSGTGTGQPGYVVADEIWQGSHHDRRGQLCMANRGKNTNGQQFFITDGAARHLDGNYTIFGQCTPESVIQKIASRKVRGDRALAPVTIKSVKIERKSR